MGLIGPLTKYFGWPASGPGSAWSLTGGDLARWDVWARQLIAASRPKPRDRA